MSFKFRYILAIACFTVSVIAGIACYSDWNNYKVGRDVYSNAVESYVHITDTAPIDNSASNKQNIKNESYNVGSIVEAPISIDFEKLLLDCPDIQGWIYCEGTSINYPIVQGISNNQYIRTTYLGEYAVSGSIFLESANSPGFTDVNNIVYGHHMKDGSMFACLQEWSSQEFYNEHPIMWLLTPEQNYIVYIFSGYRTNSDSYVYTVYKQHSEEQYSYINRAKSMSDFTSDIMLDSKSKYVVLSTCDYRFKDARYILHGKLAPIE